MDKFIIEEVLEPTAWLSLPSSPSGKPCARNSAIGAGEISEKILHVQEMHGLNSCWETMIKIENEQQKTELRMDNGVSESVHTVVSPLMTQSIQYT